MNLLLIYLIGVAVFIPIGYVIKFEKHRVRGAIGFGLLWVPIVPGLLFLAMSDFLFGTQNDK